jgi:hypothetical protein
VEEDSEDELPVDSDAERRAEERAAQERAERARVQAAQELAAQERGAQERAAQERAAQERAAQERAAQERAAQERAAQERAARQAEVIARKKRTVSRLAETECRDEPESRDDFSMVRPPLGVTGAVVVGAGGGGRPFEGTAQLEAGLRVLHGRLFAVLGGSTSIASPVFGVGLDIGYGMRSLDGFVIRAGVAALTREAQSRTEAMLDLSLSAGVNSSVAQTLLGVHLRTSSLAEPSVYIVARVDYLGATSLEEQRAVARSRVSFGVRLALSLVAAGLLAGGVAVDALLPQDQQFQAYDLVPAALYAGALTNLVFAWR